MSFRGAINKFQNSKHSSSFHKNNDGSSRGETPKAGITVKVNKGNRRGSSNYGSKVDSDNNSGEGSSAHGGHSKDWRAYFQGEELEEIFE